ncbi:MAG: thioredoxin family protein [Chitinophagaceae bacterium]|nr:thioredoxin family protein [Chitinophagaceae bacterium]
MKFILFALPAAVLLTAFSMVNTALPIGAAIPNPDLSLKDVSGKEITLKKAMKENGLLVMFSCNTCPVVKGYQARTNEVCNYALGKKVGVILLNANEGGREGGDSFEAMKTYGSNQNYKWYYAVDKDNVLADAFGASRTPECYLFDKNGKLVYKGAIDDNPEEAGAVKTKYLSDAIDAVVAGKDVATKETRSVGCGIKRKG